MEEIQSQKPYDDEERLVWCERRENKLRCIGVGNTGDGGDRSSPTETTSFKSGNAGKLWNAFPVSPELFKVKSKIMRKQCLDSWQFLRASMRGSAAFVPQLETSR